MRGKSLSFSRVRPCGIPSSLRLTHSPPFTHLFVNPLSPLVCCNLQIQTNIAFLKRHINLSLSNLIPSQHTFIKTKGDKKGSLRKYKLWAQKTDTDHSSKEKIRSMQMVFFRLLQVLRIHFFNLQKLGHWIVWIFFKSAHRDESTKDGWEKVPYSSLANWHIWQKFPHQLSVQLIFGDGVKNPHPFCKFSRSAGQEGNPAKGRKHRFPKQFHASYDVQRLVWKKCSLHFTPHLSLSPHHHDHSCHILFFWNASEIAF